MGPPPTETHRPGLITEQRKAKSREPSLFQFCFHRELGGAETKRLMQAHQPLVWMNDAIMNKGHAQAPCNPVPRNVHNTFNVTILCWTVFIAVSAMYGEKQPTGHRLDTSDGRLLEKKKSLTKCIFFSITSRLKILQLLKKKKSLGLV